MLRLPVGSRRQPVVAQEACRVSASRRRVPALEIAAGKRHARNDGPVLSWRQAGATGTGRENR